MKKIILALIAPLVLTAGFLVGTAAPAQADAWWSGQRCHSNPKPAGDGWQVCAQTHVQTIPGNPGSLWVDTVQVCMTMLQSNNHITGSFQNSYGGPIWGGIPNTGKNQCVYAYPSKAGGTVLGGSCINFSGRINRQPYPDASWSTRVRVSGANNC